MFAIQVTTHKSSLWELTRVCINALREAFGALCIIYMIAGGSEEYCWGAVFISIWIILLWCFMWCGGDLIRPHATTPQNTHGKGGTHWTVNARKTWAKLEHQKKDALNVPGEPGLYYTGFYWQNG